MADATRTVRRLGRVAGVAGARLMRRRSAPTVEDSRMTLVEHLQELRKRLLISFIAVGLAALIVGIWGYHGIFDILRQPYCHVPEKKRAGGVGCDLIFTHPTDAFFVRLKVAMVGGIIASCPIWLYQIWAFITPGLHRNERRWGVAFVVSSVALFGVGCFISYLVLGPALNVLLGFGGNGIRAFLEVNQYISFVMSMLLIFGVSFEFPLVLILLNLAGVLSSARLRSWRRVAIFLMFLFAGVATPTQDPFSMLALAIPLCVLYEVAVAVARWNDKRRAQANAESDFSGLSDDEASPLNLMHDPVDDLPSSEPIGSEHVDRDRSTARVGGSDSWDDEIT